MTWARLGGAPLIAGSVLAGAAWIGLMPAGPLAPALIAAGFMVVGCAGPRPLGGRLARAGAAMVAIGLIGLADPETTSGGLIDTPEIAPELIFATILAAGSLLVSGVLMRVRGLRRVVGLLLISGIPIAEVSSSASGSNGASVGFAMILIGVIGLGLLVAGFDPFPHAEHDGEAQDSSPAPSQGQEPSRRAHAVRWLASIAAVVSGVVLIVHPYAPCGTGRSCVYDAGISLAIPAHWIQRPATGDDLFVAAFNEDPQHATIDCGPTGCATTAEGSPEVIVQLGRSALPAPSATSSYPTTLDGLENAAAKAASEAFESGPMLDSRVALPIGPAARLAYATTFVLTYASIEHWFFVNGQPVVVRYIASPPAASANPPDLDAILSSIKPLDPSVWIWIWGSTLTGLVLTVVGVGMIGYSSLPLLPTPPSDPSVPASAPPDPPGSPVP